MVAHPTSKELLVQSLYDLMREHPFEQITVRAIAANCGLAGNKTKELRVLCMSVRIMMLRHL